MDKLVGIAVIWLLVAAMVIGTGWLSSEPRRPHFLLRLLLLLLTPPALIGLVIAGRAAGLLGEAAAGAVIGLTLLALVPSVILAPAILFESPRPSDGGEGEGGGGGPGPPPPRTPRPRGGLPLSGSEQSAARVRDHRGPWERWVRPRRSSPERERQPQRGRRF